MSLKVLMCLPSLNYNGVASYVLSYVFNISSEEIEFDFLVEEEVNDKLLNKLHKKGCKVFVISKFINIVKFKNDVKAFFNNHKYDIVHCNTVNSSMFICYYAKINNIRVRIIHSHASKISDDNTKAFIGKLMSHFAIKYATSLFACSYLAGEKIFNNKKFKVINNAIDISKYKASKKTLEFKEKYNLNDLTIIGHIGRFSTQKNHRFLINVFKEYLRINAKSKLILIGDGEEKNDIIDFVKLNDLDDYVLMFSNMDVTRILPSFNVFLLPSLYEGLPVVGIEAQAANVPLLCSDTITRELKLSKNVYFLNLNDDVSIWANAINYIIKNKVDSKLSNEYDIKIQARKLVSIYYDLVNES